MPSRLSDPFSLDLRSLALFRIALGVTLFADVVLRLPNIRAFYTDEGVLPRDALIENFANPWHVDLLLANGTPLVVDAFFALGMFLAVLLIVGYRSRCSAFLCWVFVTSVQARNPVVVHGGDEVMRLLLFWSWLLPIGARFSVDRASDPRNEPPSPTYLSVASAGLVLQICFIYWFSASLKLHPIWYREGSAAYYALNIDILATPFGKWLLQFPNALRIATFATIGFEFAGPLLVFLPFANGVSRIAACAAFVIFHVSLGATMYLGTFPWIACAGWIAILPRSFWDRVATADGSRQASLRSPSFVAEAFAGFVIVLVFAWNLAGLRNADGSGLKSPWWEIGSLLRVNQQWALFAPFPMMDDGWYVVDADLFDGRKIDPLRGGQPVSWEKPSSVALLMKDTMWRKYLMNLWYKDFSAYRRYFGRYLCRSWNTTHEHDEQIYTMYIYYMLERTPPPGEAWSTPAPNLTWRHYCFERPPDW